MCRLMLVFLAGFGAHSGDKDLCMGNKDSSCAVNCGKQAQSVLGFFPLSHSRMPYP